MCETVSMSTEHLHGFKARAKAGKAPCSASKEASKVSKPYLTFTGGMIKKPLGGKKTQRAYIEVS